jgi:hypothetical protein
MKNRKGRKAPSNIRNNVRVEPTSTVITSVKLGASDLNYEFKLDTSNPSITGMHRLSSIILPETISSVTYEGITYYQARKGA